MAEATSDLEREYTELHERAWMAREHYDNIEYYIRTMQCRTNEKDHQEAGDLELAMNEAQRALDAFLALHPEFREGVE